MIIGFKNLVIIIIFLIKIIDAQSCNDNEEELWGNCYSIEHTDSLDLSGSYLEGTIPLEIGNLINLVYLNLAANNLEGSIPEELGNLVNIQYLFLQNNQLSGSIPSSIGSLTNVISIKLYRKKTIFKYQLGSFFQ